LSGARERVSQTTGLRMTSARFTKTFANELMGMIGDERV
jgi:hypothetical protein